MVLFKNQEGMSNSLEKENSTIHSSSDSDFGHVLGKGPLGIVYALKSEPDKAVKVIRLNEVTVTDKEALRSRLHILSTLAHPNILRYRHVLQINGFIYTYMDRYRWSLKDELTDRRQRNALFTEVEILEIARQVTSALVYLHNPSKIDINGDPLPLIIHQNIKLSNILTTDDMLHFVVADLGLSIESAVPALKDINTPPYYMPPEAHLHNQYTQKSDIWALGVVILELATLREPDFMHDSGSVEIAEASWVPDLSRVRSFTIKCLIKKLLSLDPEERPSADVLLEELGGTRPEDTVRQCSLLIRRQLEFQRQIEALRKMSVKYEQQKAQLEQIYIDNQNKLNNLSPGHSLPNNLSNDSHQLIEAAKMNNVPLVKDLVQKGIGIKLQDKEGMTALMHAAQRGYDEVVSALIQYEHNLKTKNGMTALMLAAQSNRYKVVKILVEFESRMQNKIGKTALMIAVEKGHESIVRLLKTYEWNIKDCRGQTARDIAQARNRHDLVTILSDQ